ncbi:MAG: hypothetical protein MK135_11295 [Polyangiaceae bacterium]|nr:hypothetical protein [Polyangiaceae bacterium]
MSEQQKKKSEQPTSIETKAKPRLASEEPDEVAVDAPQRQTLYLLAIISIATIIMWAAGRAACNYHVDGESLTPRKTTQAERTKTPKSVAMELALSVARGRFAAASELVKGDAQSWLAAQEKECVDAAARELAAKEIFATPTVLERGAEDAWVQILTTGPFGETRSIYEVELSEKEWRVTHVLADGTPVPPLKGPPLPRRALTRRKGPAAPASATPASPAPVSATPASPAPASPVAAPPAQK